ncbi:MAG: leucine-rich repeat domain-containing protein [Actinomycetota bacterium]|nr:leucine-rich repeat domain-containing protein [Actinomycetota bacterium]
MVKFEGGSANNQVSGKYNEGAVVGIESIPDPDYTGYQFIRWEVNVGDAANVADTGSASTTVTMNEEMELTAILEESTPEEFFTFDSTTGTITAYNFTGGLDVVIPPTIGGIPVEHIGDMAFWDSSNTYNLTSVIIPYGVTSIGNSAFYENNLTSVIIPNSVTSIGNSAFDGNLLPSVDIPDSVTSLGEQAFNDNLLTSIDIPDYVTHIDNYTFGDNLLTTVTIPDLVTTIDTSAFANNQLTSVIIGSAVTTINEWAFNGNTITSITIGAGVNIVDTGYQDTMGEYSEYFKVAYDGGGKLAGTYNYTGIWPDYWVKE